METFNHLMIAFSYELEQIKENVCKLNLYKGSKLLNDFYGKDELQCVEFAKLWINERVGQKPEKSLKIKVNSDYYDDNFGNSIVVEADGTVRLNLTNRKPRNIGQLVKEKSLFITKRVKSKHLFNKTKSYGFNYKFLRENYSFNYVFLNETDDTNDVNIFNEYKIPKQAILEGEQLLNFKEQGFELQVFLPLNKIIEYKI